VFVHVIAVLHSLVAVTFVMLALVIDMNLLFFVPFAIVQVIGVAFMFPCLVPIPR